MEKIKTLLSKKVLLAGGVIVLLTILLVIISLTASSPEEQPGRPGKPEQPTPTSGSESKPARPRIITISGITPKDGAKDVSQTDVVKITFADSMPREGVTITFIPEIPGKYQTDTNSHTIAFVPNYAFRANTTYEAHLIMKQSFITPEHESTTAYFWSFTTGEQQGESSFTPEDAEQFIKQRQAADQAYAERKKKFPFIIYMPHVTKNYRIDISSVSDTFTITTYATHPTIHEYYKKEAQQWLEGKGADISTLTIRYVQELP